MKYIYIAFKLNHIKKSTVVACAGVIHRSPKFWAKPYEFYPEHFLDPDGQLRQNVEGFIPFSMGIYNLDNKSCDDYTYCLILMNR